MKDKLNKTIQKLSSEASYAIHAATLSKEISEMSFWFGNYWGVMDCLEKLDYETWKSLLEEHKVVREYCGRCVGRRSLN